MHSRIRPILDILDQGLALYRRNVLGFLLISASWFVPILIGIGLSIAAAAYLGDTVMMLILFGWMILAVPLLLYLISGMSHATLAAQRGEPVRFRDSLRVPPLRMAGMGCYSIIFTIIANMISSAVSMLCICPVYLMLVALMTSSVALFGSNTSGIETAITLFGMLLLSLLFVLLYGFSLVMSGASYISVIYAIQPFLHDKLSFGDTISRSVNLIFYRFGYNLMGFLLASAIFSAISVAVTVAIGVLLPLPLFWLLGGESPIAQASSAVAWFIGFIVVLPPVPIWMTLFYQRNLQAYHGTDLAERIAALAEPAPVGG